MSLKVILHLALFMAFAATVNALYISPNPWTVSATQSLAANITQAPTLLFRRQDLPGAGGSPTTIYANGQFLDPSYASFFDCTSSPTSSEPPPSPPPPPPSPTPDKPPGAQPNCNTHDHLNEVELERGATISSFVKDDMRDLFEDQCHRKNQHFPITEHKDIGYVVKVPKVRLVMDARAEDGTPDPLKFDADACVEDFHRVLDNSKSLACI
ncbi:MAG: hypothetical protein LQ343_002860 [Gyalolechia ehrenbergii]|nr:MAG: hypothetical protein LQ343_002860 [Gyalolechia ehrenbergii]